MADENNEDDSWLYGTNAEGVEIEKENSETNGNDEKQEHEPSEEQDDQTDGNAVNEEATEDGNGDEEGQNGGPAVGSDKEVEEKSDGEHDDSDSDDEDDVVVVIGDIKSGSNYNIKQRGLLAAGAATIQEKPKTNMGKFSIEEFESVGTISGQLAHEFSIDSLDEKPWRKPGADITDYFNYGFNEETWRAYCEKQKKMRLHESGVGLQGLAANSSNSQQGNSNLSNRTLTSLTSTDNSKYPASGPINSNPGLQKFQNRPGFGAPPGRNDMPSKENVIQVMTAERREYSRAKGKFEVPMMPPPTPAFTPVNEPFYPEDNFSYGYEPTQEQQWNNEGAGWVPSGIKELTPGPQMVPPPGGHMNMNMPPPRGPMMGPPQMMNNMNMPPMAPPPHMGMVPPPQIPMMHPPHGQMMHRDRPERNEREDRGVEYREMDDKRNSWRNREKEREYGDRSRDRPERDRGKSEEMERAARPREEDSPSRDRERRRERDRYRERERSSRRERSRSRERSERRRRSKSRESTRDSARDKDREKDRDKDRKSRDKKKSHKKDKDDSE